jgi:hypothetical protein
MEPEYNHLAEVLRDIPSIVIAKMDGTKNEHSLVEVSYFFNFPIILHILVLLGRCSWNLFPVLESHWGSLS